MGIICYFIDFIEINANDYELNEDYLQLFYKHFIYPFDW